MLLKTYFNCAILHFKLQYWLMGFALMHKVKWGDLQYIMTIAAEGSVSGAARSLGVNHSTVLRRLDAFEFRHKVKLFKRSSTGYKFTEKGKLLLESSVNIEREVQHMERLLTSYEFELEGWLRITTTDALFHYLLAQHLSAFQQTYSKIQLDISLTPKPLDLASLESDIAIRSVDVPPQGIGGEKLLSSSIYTYATNDYLEQFGSRLQIQLLDWLIPSMVNLNNPLWNRALKNITDKQIKVKADSFNALLSLAESGMGVAILPDFLGDKSTKLTRIDIIPNLPQSTIWILAHEDLLKSRKVTALSKYLKSSFANN
jgi:DNA-binding transcriptional LysR family regulator